MHSIPRCVVHIHEELSLVDAVGTICDGVDGRLNLRVCCVDHTQNPITGHSDNGQEIRIADVVWKAEISNATGICRQPLRTNW